MTMNSPHVVRLTEEQRSQLQAVVRKASAQQRQVLRARIVLAAAAGEAGVDENNALDRLLAAHADMEQVFSYRTDEWLVTGTCHRALRERFGFSR